MFYKICYLCGKKTVNTHFQKLGFNFYRCKSCGLITLDFKDNYQSFLSSFYQKGYFTGDKKIRAYADYTGDKSNVVKNSQTILKKINHEIKPKRKRNILDIGCAMGFFLEEARREKFNVYGIEVSKYAAEIAAKKFGKSIFLGSVEEFFEKRKNLPNFRNIYFDAVVLSDIIEHLQDPRKVLSNLKKVIKDDGILVIQTGDVDSFWAKLMGKNWHFFAPPQHLFFFSKKTLTKLLSQAGYKIINIYKEGKYVSINYLLYMLFYMNFTKIGDKLLKFISKTPLGKISLYIKLFDNMIVIAKKT